MLQFFFVLAANAVSFVIVIEGHIHGIGFSIISYLSMEVRTWEVFVGGLRGREGWPGK